MSDFKDHFSKQSKGYGKFRPLYPPEMYAHLSGLCADHGLAWDCATGTGQAARGLSPFFDRVVATDGSEKQITHATGPNNVDFRVATAEQSGLASSSVDLITVAQALHWFDREAFYQEVRRVLKPGGILAVWTYNLLCLEGEIDSILNRFNEDIVGDYWPSERQLVRDEYRTISFPFPEVPMPQYAMEASWSMEELLGYLATWSSVARYKTTTGRDPLAEIQADLTAAWGEVTSKKTVRWPLTFRVGKP